MKSMVAGCTIFLCFLVASLCEAQDSTPEQDVKFHIDFVGFKNLSGEGTYQEVYLSLSNRQLTYILKDEKHLAGYRIALAITNAQGDVVAEKAWEGFSRIDSLGQAQRQISLEAAGFVLPPGEYVVGAQITDLNSGAVGSLQTLMVVSDFLKDDIELSEIEFARSISRTSEQSVFAKSGYSVVPNPSRVFGLESPFVYFYAEIYNLGDVGENSHEISREWEVVDGDGNVVETSERTVETTSTTLVWIDKINTLRIPSGKYVLRIRITDRATGANAERETEFWVSNLAKGTPLAKVDEAELEEARAQIVYLLKESELKMFDQLNPEGKIEYLNRFWAGQTAELRREHLRRFRIAQEQFEAKTVPGWKTDRGRVYIMYGPPDEVEREPAKMDSRAYEVWIYQSLANQGHVEFVFADFGVIDNYELIHCTLKSGERYEVYDPLWEERLIIAR